jgi:hypothetical protein
MRADVSTVLLALFRLPPRLNPWQWAEAHVDYSRSPSYDTEWRGPYDADYLPYLKEPMEACDDPLIREVWFLACTRGGKSENLLHTYMRYRLATSPPHAILYIGGQQSKVEQAYQRRIIRGMQLSDETARMIARSIVREHTTDFAGLCDLTISWAANKQVGKGDTYPLILADEVSSWPSFKADVLRERQANVSFPKLIGVSSPDAENARSSDEDPIFQEYEATDMRIYVMPDPKGGEFSYRMGDPSGVDGVRWDVNAKRDDGTWDLEAVRATAHYVTPSGARLDEKDRMDLVGAGHWQPTRKCESWKRGYKATRFMVPIRSGSFGDMACAFLEANRKQKAHQYDEKGRSPLRVFVYERLAERYYETRDEVAEEEVMLRTEPGLLKGFRLSDLTAWKETCLARDKLMLMTIDVQKDYYYWLVREWIHPGDSGLVAWGTAPTKERLIEVAERYAVAFAGIDRGFADRKVEVLEFCLDNRDAAGRQWIIPLKGTDNLPGDLLPEHLNAYLGVKTKSAGDVDGYQWNSGRFRKLYHAMMSGHSRQRWRIYENVEAEYVRQASAWECVDGVWRRRRGHPQEHLADCEIMQLVLARLPEVKLLAEKHGAKEE